jgi:hypothetical protein
MSETQKKLVALIAEYSQRQIGHEWRDRHHEFIGQAVSEIMAEETAELEVAA